MILINCFCSTLIQIGFDSCWSIWFNLSSGFCFSKAHKDLWIVNCKNVDWVSFFICTKVTLSRKSYKSILDIILHVPNIDHGQLLETTNGCQLLQIHTVLNPLFKYYVAIEHPWILNKKIDSQAEKLPSENSSSFFLSECSSFSFYFCVYLRIAAVSMEIRKTGFPKKLCVPLKKTKIIQWISNSDLIFEHSNAQNE